MAKIEVFTAGCPLCEEAVIAAREGACPNCEVLVYDLHDDGIAEKAHAYGIDRLPTVVVNGEIVGCCSQGKPDAESIRATRLASH